MFGEAEPKGPVATGFAIAAGDRIWEVDKVFSPSAADPTSQASGSSSLGSFSMIEAGHCDPETLRIGDTNIYIAGDASGGRAI